LVGPSDQLISGIGFGRICPKNDNVREHR
jgi:hypothetical protein